MQKTLEEPEERRFSEADLRRWVREGLISQAQLETILKAEQPERRGRAPGGEVQEGLNLPTIFYYLGTSLALVAVGVFAGINWEDVGKSGRLVLIALIMASLNGAGLFVRQRTPFRRGGGALFTIAVGMIPLLFFTLGDFVAGSERDAIFDDEMLGQASLIQFISLTCMVIILAWSRIGMTSIAVSGQAVALVATASIWWLSTEGDHEVEIFGILTGLGGLLILSGLAARGLRRSEEAFWFALAGHLVFFVAFTGLVMTEWNAGAAVLYLLAFIAFILVSVMLQQTIFLVAGVAGIFAFVLRLVAETFEGSPFLPLAIAMVGVAMVLLAMAYQRYRPFLPLPGAERPGPKEKR